MSTGKKVPVAVAGATGYAGAELVRLLAAHPAVEITVATSERDAGRPIGEVHRSLAHTGLTLVKLDPGAVAAAAEVALLALPHGESTPVVARLLDAGVRVVDLGADFRLSDPDLYARWYGVHDAPGLLGEAVYGLTEFARADVAGARLVANPGCYPTGALLALLPLAERLGGVVFVDSKSGTSGAGRGAATDQLFAEVTENVRPYAVWHHRHQPEIESHLARSAGRDVPVRFTPHLLPIARGLLTACYVQLRPGRPIGELFERAYADEPFIRLLGDAGVPEPRQVRGTNLAEIAWRQDERTGTAVLLTAIDNLGKGAAGQAVQNLNCMLGIDETTGLDQTPALP